MPLPDVRLTGLMVTLLPPTLVVSKMPPVAMVRVSPPPESGMELPALLNRRELMVIVPGALGLVGASTSVAAVNVGL